MAGLQEAGAARVAGKALRVIKRAARSLKAVGTLTVDVNCLTSLEPDLVAAVLVSIAYYLQQKCAELVLTFGSQSSSNKPTHFSSSSTESDFLHHMGTHLHYLGFASWTITSLESAAIAASHLGLSLGLGLIMEGVITGYW